MAPGMVRTALPATGDGVVVAWGIGLSTDVCPGVAGAAFRGESAGGADSLGVAAAVTTVPSGGTDS